MLWLASSRRCPKCGAGTVRVHTRWYLRPLRWMLPRHTSTRACLTCGWSGFRFFTTSLTHRHS